MPDLHPHSPTAHRKPTDLFGDPIDSHPQWFKQSSFLDPNFDPESYISDLRTFVPFETLRSELRSHLASLKHELVELINRDYADFVNLSTKLVDVDASVVRMRAPLNELREKIVVFRAAVEDSLVKLRNGLQQRADAQAAREVLEVLLDTFHVVSKENHYFTMAVTFYNLSSEAGIKKLDEYLLSRSYISGYQASKDDLAVHAALAKPPSSNYVNVSRWYNHIEALLRISGVSADGCGVTVEGSSVATPPVADTKASAAEDDDDDDVDLFGEETEEEKKAAEERAAAVKASGKKKESGKSSVLLDVKPWDDETDMTKLEEAVRSIKKEGLLWGASKLVPVGYGIKKLQIMLTIVDDLVSVDDLVEDYLTAEPANEYIQSCDIVAFNKI